MSRPGTNPLASRSSLVVLLALALGLVGCPHRGALPQRDGGAESSIDNYDPCTDPDLEFLPEECFAEDDITPDDAGDDTGDDAEGPDSQAPHDGGADDAADAGSDPDVTDDAPKPDV